MKVSEDKILCHLQAPWYNSYVAHQGEVNDMRDDLESILYQFGVDIVFAGELACKYSQPKTWALYARLTNRSC